MPSVFWCKASSRHGLRTALPVLLLLLLLLTFVSSCVDGVVSNKYCSLPAKFTVSNILSVPPLYHACQNQGMFCSIIAQNKQFVFDNLSSSVSVNQDASIVYTGFYMGLSGFIVGLPNAPELGENSPVVTCYDLACPNCYVDASVTRRMTLKEGGYVSCSRCSRTYNLNNIGIVSDGASGRSLYRYRVYYNGTTLSINNN